MEQIGIKDLSDTDKRRRPLTGEEVGSEGIRAAHTIQVDSTGTIVDPATTISITPPSQIGDGNKTVTTAGTAVALASSTSCQYVVITALLANTGLISVGGSTTTPSGTVRGDVLAAGDSTTVLVDNLSKVYINSTVNSEGVSYRYG